METLQRTANRGSVSTGYDIDNSCRFEGANNEWVYLDSPTAGDRKTFTVSFWFKRSESKDAIVIWQGTHGRIRFQSDDIRLRFASGHELETTRKIRDYSAWYHLVIACDTTQGTAANRVKMYVNGIQETAFETATYPDEDDDSDLMTTDNLYISAGDGDFDYSGYIAEFNLIDGTQYAATDFGEFDSDSGIWIPKKFTGTYGDEGVYLKFDNSGSMGADSSGNSNNFTLTNVDATNQTTDTPTNNFCTLNPIDTTVNATYAPTISIGSLKYEASGSGASTIRGTMGMSKGKWYWEVKVATNANGVVGVGTANAVIPLASSQSNGYMWDSPTGDTHSFSIYGNTHFYSYMSRSGTANATQVAYADGTMDAGDIMSVAYDADNQDIYLALSGSWTDVVAGQDPTQGGGTDTAYTYHSYFNNDEDTIWLPSFSEPYNQDMEVNFGNPTFTISSGNADANGYGNFEYAVPSGFYALCTKNIAEFG